MVLNRREWDFHRRTLAILRALTTAILLFPSVGFSDTQKDFKDYKDVQLSDLLKIDVTTASKVTQTLLETPVAITVIDRQQIESYGVQSIPELLRGVVGVDVVMYDSGDYVVGMRGNYSSPTNNMLVLLDGKNTYQNVYGFVLWNALPVSVDEIERIEIIRGPASSLYGANAAMGVVNIITRTDDTDGFRIAAGTPGVRHGTLQLNSHNDRIQFSTGLTYRAINSFDRSRDQPANSVPIVNAKLALHLSNDRTLTFFVGGTRFADEAQLGLLAYTRLENNTFGQISATYESKAATIHAYFNRTALHDPTLLLVGGSKLPASIHETVGTTDYARSQEHNIFGQRARLLWGGDVQLNRISSTLIDRDRSQLLASGFIQEEYRPTGNLLVMAGARLDKHPVTHHHLSPRTSLTYVFGTNQALRFAYGDAYRNPTILETYGYVAGGRFFVGNDRLVAEQVRNIEVGYRGALGTRVSVGATGYVLRQTGTIGPQTTPTPGPPPAPCQLAGAPIFPARSTNGRPCSSQGLEIENDDILTSFLRVRLNYRWLGDPIADNIYRHTMNSQWDVRMGNGFSFDLRTNWYLERIDRQLHASEPSTLFLAHAFISHPFATHGHELTPYLSVFNLTNRHAAEIVDFPSDIRLRRSVVGGVRGTF